MPVPEDEYYEGFPQIENGIGLVRDFIDNWDNYSGELLKQHRNKKSTFCDRYLLLFYLKRIDR